MLQELLSMAHYISAAIRLCSHRHECEHESKSKFLFTSLSLVQASPVRMERSRSLVQAQLNACLLTMSSEIK